MAAGIERRGGVFNRPNLLYWAPGLHPGRPAEGRSRKESNVKDYKRTKEYRVLRASLLDNLRERGLDAQCYTDKVDEYMDFWALRRQLLDDVAARGLTVTDERGRMSENRSVSLAVQTARQMQDILRLLGIGAIRQNDEDDEL